MMKNIFLLFLILILLFTILTLHEFYNNKQALTTFKAYVEPQLKISNQLFLNYQSDDSLLREEAAKSIILTTLKNLNYEQWIAYTDYINLKIAKANVLPSDGDELIVALNLSKDLAVIAIYTLVNNEYVFAQEIEDLLPVQNITFLPSPESGYNFIITEQLLDERLGAFLIEEFIEIFLYMDDHFKSVWKKTKYTEEIYQAQWLDPDQPSNVWIKVVERNAIAYHNKPSLSISVSIHKQKFRATKDTFPAQEDFKPQEDIVTAQYYYWNPTYRRFIMGEGVIHDTIATVAILDDTENWIESFLGFKSNNYKVLSLSGEVFYINKENITRKQ